MTATTRAGHSVHAFTRLTLRTARASRSCLPLVLCFCTACSEGQAPDGTTASAPNTGGTTGPTGTVDSTASGAISGSSSTTAPGTVTSVGSADGNATTGGTSSSMSVSSETTTTTTTATGSSSGSGGAGGSAGTVTDTSTGAGGIGTGGMTGAGGTSAVGGVTSSGGTGAAGIADGIHEFRLESPCIDADHFGANQPDNCDVEESVDRQTYELTLGGDSAVIYDVKLRVRGLAEPNTYQGGMLEPDFFYVGGQTTQPGYTAYSLTVADPAEIYFFNYNSSVGHFVMELDYEAVIPMRGGTRVTFDVNGQTSVPDGHGVSNRNRVVVEGVPPAPEPFNGQFIQFDVLEVTPQQHN